MTGLEQGKTIKLTKRFQIIIIYLLVTNLLLTTKRYIMIFMYRC